jgi:ATP-dependent Clp protease adapter protein ClpS
MANKLPDENDFGLASDSLFGEELTVMAPKVHVIFHDDEVTPVDFVLFLLQTHLGYDEARAREVVQNIASSGSFRVATLPRPSADALMQRLSRVIGEAGYPFKVTLSAD